MKAAAIIAEYNPFHKGHHYHLNLTREQLGATHIVVIMSGNFVQRGDCACLPKQVRAKMALLGGADLVIELPLPWAVAGAEKFALGGVALAEALGVTDILSFGSETGNIELIKSTARAVTLPETGARLRRLMNEGVTFAAARARAVAEFMPEAEAVLRSPNDTLGVEYCKALNTLGSSIEPMCVNRRGAAHDSREIGDSVSASLIRERLNAGEDVNEFIPSEALEPLKEALESGSAPALLERLDRTVLYRLRGMTAEEIALLPDVSEGLENRILRCARNAASVAELCDAVKVKRYTHARIRRIVLSALLGLTAQDSSGTPPYIRVLGMNGRGRELLHKASPSLPIITRHADASELNGTAQHILKLEEAAGDIFALALPTPACCGSDAASGIIII